VIFVPKDIELCMPPAKGTEKFDLHNAKHHRLW